MRLTSHRCLFAALVAAALTAVISSAGATEASSETSAPLETAPLVKTYVYDFDRDLDADGQPDLWTRTIDDDHPGYVHSQIDFESSQAGKSALRFDAGGASAEFLSPPVAIDTSAAYDVSGFIKALDLPSKGLRATRAFIRVYLYDDRGRLVGSLKGFPDASGTTDWLQVRVLDVTRKYPQARRLRVAAILEGLSLTGCAWFDTIEVRRRPIAFLRTNRPGNAFVYSGNKEMTFNARGIPPGDYSLKVTITNILGDKVHSVSLKAQATPEGTVSVIYPLPDLPVGLYQLEVDLSNAQVAALKHVVRLGILPDPRETETAANFGVSLSRFPDEESRQLELAAATGARWIKLPLAEAGADTKTQRLQAITNLRRAGLTPVGILSSPGKADTWVEGFGDTVNTFAGRVQSWQLGGEGDTSLVGSAGGDTAFAALRRFVNEVSFAAQLGVSSSAGNMARLIEEACPDFVSMEAGEFKATGGFPPSGAPDTDGPQFWVCLSLSDWRYGNTATAAAHLAQEVAHLFELGANVVFFKDPWGDQGLLDAEGNVTAFGLAVSTLVHELANHQYVGSISLPNGTPNAIFTRDNNTKVLLWPADEPREERIFLGDALEMVDMYGHRSAARLDEGENVLFVEKAPIIVSRVNQAVVRTRQTFKVEPEMIDSIYEMQPVRVSFVNEFGSSIVGELTVRFPIGWDTTRKTFFIRLKPGETFHGQTEVLVPINVLSGPQEVYVSLDVGGAGTQKTTIVRRLQLGSRAFTMAIETRIDGPDLRVYQKVTNISARAVNIVAFLDAEGMERTEKPPVTLAAGSITTFSYKLADARSWQGRNLRATVRDRTTNRFLNQQFQIPRNTVPK
ncbi:MAG: hypothetical protein J7M19_05115 [Planctomycetes bacterium]|nr:hypothetical protein [Planctomycetota bacterium]